MIHERCHGILLGCGARVGVWITVKHVGPVVSGGSEISGKGAVVICPVVAIIGVAASACGGPVVIFHKLRHGCGHAAHSGFIVSGSRTEVVVGRTLIPCGGEEGADGGDGLWSCWQVSGTEIVPLIGDFLRRHLSVQHCCADSAVVKAEPGADVVRQIAATAVVRIGIAENRNGTVVIRDQHEAGAVHIVEDVEMFHTDALGNLLENRQSLFWEIQSPECLCEIFGFHRIDGRRPRQTGHDENHNQKR